MLRASRGRARRTLTLHIYTPRILIGARRLSLPLPRARPSLLLPSTLEGTATEGTRCRMQSCARPSPRRNQRPRLIHATKIRRAAGVDGKKLGQPQSFRVYSSIVLSMYVDPKLAYSAGAARPSIACVPDWNNSARPAKNFDPAARAPVFILCLFSRLLWRDQSLEFAIRRGDPGGRVLCYLQCRACERSVQHRLLPTISSAPQHAAVARSQRDKFDDARGFRGPLYARIKL